MKRKDVKKYQKITRQKLEEAGIPILDETKIEIADFGLNKFEEIGLALVTRINEKEYCSKWLIIFPKQVCPEHYHELKKETFFCHKGCVMLNLPDKTITLNPGEYYTLEKGNKHSFTSKKGAIVEEISTYDENADSFFTNKNIIRDSIIEDD
ncbi:MAG: D-lyxose/D-mannose family sugar isomerase [Promethearchaeota archaeon]